MLLRAPQHADGALHSGLNELYTKQKMVSPRPLIISLNAHTIRMLCLSMERRRRMRDRIDALHRLVKCPMLHPQRSAS